MIHTILTILAALTALVSGGHRAPLGATAIKQFPAETSLQESYFSQNGKYLQLINGKTLDGIVVDTSDVTIHTYEMPTGEAGYQIIKDNGTTITSYGYGPEAKDRTYTRVRDITVVASSTQ